MFFIPKRHRPTLFALTKLKWKTNTKRHSQADDLRTRFKGPEWGVFCHTARLRNRPPTSTEFNLKKHALQQGA